MPGEEPQSNLVRVARLNPQTALLAAILGVGGIGGVRGNAKLDESLELAHRLEGQITELRAQRSADEKLELDRRVRKIEEVGSERRFERIEAELEQVRKAK